MLKLKSNKSIIFILLIFVQCLYGQTTTISDAAPEAVINLEKEINEVVASDNEAVLYLSDKEGKLYAFDLKKYGQLWNSALGGKSSSNILEIQDRILFITKIVSESISVEPDNSDMTYNLWSIDKESGITKNHIKIKGKGKFLIIRKDNNSFFLVDNLCRAQFDSKLDLISDVKCLKNDSASDNNLYNRSLFDKTSNNLYLIHENNIYNTSLFKDDFTKKIYSQSNSISSFAVFGNHILVGDNIGNLSLFDVERQQNVWKFRGGGKISDINIFQSIIIVSSYDNFLYCLDKQTGDLVWKKRLPGRIIGVQKYMEKFLKVKTSYSDDIFLVNIENGQSIYQNTSFDTDKDQEFSKTYQTTHLIINQNYNSIDIRMKN